MLSPSPRPCIRLFIEPSSLITASLFLSLGALTIFCGWRRSQARGPFPLSLRSLTHDGYLRWELSLVRKRSSHAFPRLPRAFADVSREELCSRPRVPSLLDPDGPAHPFAPSERRGLELPFGDVPQVI